MKRKMFEVVYLLALTFTKKLPAPLPIALFRHGLLRSSVTSDLDVGPRLPLGSRRNCPRVGSSYPFHSQAPGAVELSDTPLDRSPIAFYRCCVGCGDRLDLGPALATSPYHAITFSVLYPLSPLPTPHTLSK